MPDPLLQDRMQLDLALGEMFNEIGATHDADAQLFREVFDRPYLSLAHVERMLVVAKRLEAHVRYRRQWRGR
jgi:hypothetical protein